MGFLDGLSMVFGYLRGGFLMFSMVFCFVFYGVEAVFSWF